MAVQVGKDPDSPLGGFVQADEVLPRLEDVGVDVSRLRELIEAGEVRAFLGESPPRPDIRMCRTEDDPFSPEELDALRMHRDATTRSYRLGRNQVADLIRTLKKSA